MSNTRLTAALVVLLGVLMGLALAQGGGPPPSPAPDPWEAPDAPTGQYGAPIVGASNTGSTDKTYKIDVDNGDTSCAYQIQEYNGSEWVNVGGPVEISEQSDTVTLGGSQRLQIMDYDSADGTGKPSGDVTQQP